MINCFLSFGDKNIDDFISVDSLVFTFHNDFYQGAAIEIGQECSVRLRHCDYQIPSLWGLTSGRTSSFNNCDSTPGYENANWHTNPIK